MTLKWFDGMIKEAYGYFAVISGAVSVFFSVALIITELGLPYQFGYVKGQIDMTFVDASVDTAIWVITLVVFLIYPAIIREARSSRAVLLSHGATLFLLVSMFLWSASSLFLAIGNIVAYAIALHRSPRYLGILRLRAVTLSLAAVLVLPISVGIVAFYVWSGDPFAALKAYSGMSGLFTAGRFDLGVFYVGYALTVWLIVSLIASPILLEVGDWLVRRRASRREVRKTEGSRLRISSLAFGVAGASVLVALIAYLPYSLTPYPVGIDAHFYSVRLQQLSEGTSPWSLFRVDPRVVYVLLLYAVRLGTGLPIRETILAGVAITSVLFAVGSLFLVREAGFGDLASLLAACLGGLSPQMFVGTLSSIYPNWLALAEMLFFFGFLLRALRTSGRSSFFAGCVLSLVILATHPWTWAILVLILGIYAVLFALKERSWRSLRDSVPFRVLCVSVIMGLVVFAAATMFAVGWQIVDLGYSWALLMNLRLSRTPLEFLRDLQIALFNYSTDGFYSNWFMLILALVGVVGLRRIEWKARILIESWILCPSILILLLGWEIQWRLLFLIPYNFLAAVGLFTLLSVLSGRPPTAPNSNVDSLILKAVQLGLVVFLLLLFLNNAARSMTLIATQVVL